MDIKYWTKFYQKHKTNTNPSLFARFVYENYLSLQAAPSLLELGCGNGRDAFYFAQNGVSVVAIDQIEEEIAYLSAQKKANTSFVCGDFTQLDDLKAQFNCIYSRFTLHSISLKEQKRLFKALPHLLCPNGILAIEARGYKNSLYKKGEPVSLQEDAFIYDGHYRRFVNFELLCDELKDSFELVFAKEQLGFAPFNNQDDYFFRIIALASNKREREREREREAARNRK